MSRSPKRALEPLPAEPDVARDRAVVARLGAWFDRSARDLPWRRTRDPYAIWVSEVMLQQTRVETVIPYYERFLRRYPDVRSLAAAEPDAVLSMWSGLGYYRRARELHAAARQVADQHGGELPSDAAGLRELRGIGAYTAGAVASIAFDRREPLVDGNVARVLARIFGIADDVRSPAGSRRLWATAARLVPADRPGRFNQALMELGATVCAPREPRCAGCPVRACCVAAAEGRQAELPVVGERRAPKAVAIVAAVLRQGARVLLARRVEGGLFGGLWEPPMVEARSLVAARKALGAAGLASIVASLRRAGRVRHVLSHRELDVVVAKADVVAPWEPASVAAPYERMAWLDPEGDGFGISTLAKKILAAAPPRRVPSSTLA